MAVNRFYSPQHGTYISQFVPEELPANLMLQALNNKQKQYDTAQTNLNVLGDWNTRSLGDYDTNYVKGKQSEIRNFIDTSQGQDLSSPEYTRKYVDFVRKFKGDEGLKAVASSVAIDDEYQKRIKDLKDSKDGFAYANALEHEYSTRRQEYTKRGGQGFKGQIQLGDPNVLTGVDKLAEAKPIFDDLKESGSEVAKELEQGVYYKNGWQGVSDKTTTKQALAMMENFSSGRAGQQMKAEFAQKQFGNQIPSEAYKKLDVEQRKEYDKKEQEYIKQFLVSAGKEFVHNKTTTNIDESKNKLADWGREDMKTFAQQPVIDVLGNTTAIEMPKYDETFGNGVTDKGVYNRTLDDINNAKATGQVYNKLIDYATKGGMPRNKMGQPILSQQEKLMLQGIPGADQFINGQPVPQNVKDTFIKVLQSKVEDNNFKIHTNEIYKKQIDEKMQTVANTLLGDKKYNGLSFKATIENGEEAKKELESDPVYKQYLSDVSKTKSDPYLKNKGIDYQMIMQKNIIDNLSKSYKTASGAEKEKIGETIKNMQALHYYHKATDDMSRVYSNEDNKDKLKELYNNTQEYQPTATPKPLSKTYMAYEKDASGKVNKTGVTLNADYIMEDLIRKSPSSFIVKDASTGKEISPTMINEDGISVPNPDYPSGTTLQLVSSNKELLNDRFKGELMGPKAIFNVKGTSSIIVPDGTDPKGEKLDVKPVDKNYIFVANEVPTKQYTSAKAKEAYSNYIVNPNSEDGKSSYMNYVMYSDPVRYKDISKVNSMTEAGQRTYISKRMFNPDSGRDENLKVKVTKSEAGDGDLILKVTDNQGNEVIPDTRVKNTIQLDKYLQDIETNFKAEKENRDRLGVH